MAVTGVGLVCPSIGTGSADDSREAAWARLLTGEPCFRPGTPGAGPGTDALMLAAVRRAVADSAAGDNAGDSVSRLTLPDSRTGWVLGASKSDPATWGPGGDRLPWPWLRPDGAHAVCDRFAATGPRLAPVAACATGVVAVARAADLIRHGTCDRVICGAADASRHPLILASFAKLGVLADPGDDPAGCVRPFDARRGGFAVGEGAAAFVLERADRTRPGTAYATIAGSAIASAAVRLVDVDPAGEAVGRVLRESCGGAPPDLLGLHGTATRANDPAETAGVRAAFGEAAADLPAFASKGATGHLLGAAGAVELAFTLLALRDGVVPPTVNLREQDPACGLNLTPSARPRPLRTAAKVSLGFGGTVAAVALRRGDREPRGRPAP